MTFLLSARTPRRRSAAALVLVVSAIVANGCATSRYARSVLPPGLDGAAPPISDEHAIAIDAERVRLTREYLAIHNPEVAAALPPGEGPEAIAFTPRMVLVHFTDIPTLQGTLDAFAGPEIGGYREVVRAQGALNVGIQFVVDRDGTIYRLYPETAIARHVIGLNHVAIGIENVGNGDLGDARAEAPLTTAQVAANDALIRYLAGKYPTIEWVVAHSEYTDVEDPRHPAHALFHEEIPDYRTEKVDPGPRFMKALRRRLAD